MLFMRFAGGVSATDLTCTGARLLEETVFINCPEDRES